MPRHSLVWDSRSIGTLSASTAKRYFVMDRKRLIWFSLRTRGLKVSREIDKVRKKRAMGRAGE